MIGKNDVGAVADEEIAVHFHAGRAQRIDFLHEGERIEHYAVADNTAAAFAQHAAGNQLQDELLALDGDRVSRIVAAGITRDDLEALREHVNDFAFAFVAPLCADDDCCLACFQLAAPLAVAGFGRATARFRTRSPLTSEHCMNSGNDGEADGVTLDFTGSGSTHANLTPGERNWFVITRVVRDLLFRC